MRQQRSAWWRRGGRRSRAPGLPPPGPPPTVVAVASGKGGTGKSLVAANLALWWCRRGRRVLLVDADLGLANAHLLLGLTPARSLAQVVLGEAALPEVLLEGPWGLRLLPGGVGVPELAALGEPQLYALAGELLGCARDYDRVVLDTAAGLGRATLAFLALAGRVVLVTTPEITALTDAYALLKTLWRARPETGVDLLINRLPPGLRAWDVYDRIGRVAARYLGRRPRFLGGLPEDGAVPRALGRRVPVLLHAPRSPFVRRFLRVVRGLEDAVRLAPASSCATL